MPTNQYGEAAAKLDGYGEDALCRDILDGITLTDIAVAVDVSIGSLLSWRDADPERSARAREARVKRAEMWDELAVTELRGATDKLTLGIAKEIAHHYRWRASKIAPADYGDRMQTQQLDKDGNATDPVTEIRITVVK